MYTSIQILRASRHLDKILSQGYVCERPTSSPSNSKTIQIIQPQKFNQIHPITIFDKLIKLGKGISQSKQYLKKSYCLRRRIVIKLSDDE